MLGSGDWGRPDRDEGGYLGRVRGLRRHGAWSLDYGVLEALRLKSGEDKRSRRAMRPRWQSHVVASRGSRAPPTSRIGRLGLGDRAGRGGQCRIYEAQTT